MLPISVKSKYWVRLFEPKLIRSRLHKAKLSFKNDKVQFWLPKFTFTLLILLPKFFPKIVSSFFSLFNELYLTFLIRGICFEEIFKSQFPSSALQSACSPLLFTIIRRAVNSFDLIVKVIELNVIKAFVLSNNDDPILTIVVYGSNPSPSMWINVPFDETF